MKQQVRGFIEFVREQGVVGLAVGFMLGGAISKMVSSIVNDLVNPFLGFLLGSAGDIRSASFQLGRATVTWGNFVGSLIDFLVVACVVYFGVRIVKLDRLDKKKQ